MKDENKGNKRLLNESKELRKRVAEMEASEAQCKQAEERRQDLAEKKGDIIHPLGDKRDIIIPEAVIEKWQNIVNIMARLIRVPVGLIMKVNEPYIEVFRSSESKGNPYKVGDHEHLHNSGLYCETVIKTQKKLLVPDALRDPDWNKNPDIKLGMISYLGFPILWPNGEVFGTICVLDLKENNYSKAYEELMLQFKEIAESHLALLCHREHLEKLVEQRTAQLKSSKDRIEHFNIVLRAIRKVNQLIVIEKDRDKLLQSACNCLTKTRGYDMAWAVLFDENGAYLTSAESGLGTQFLPMVEYLKNGQLPQCATQALKQSEIVVVKDSATYCKDCPIPGKPPDKGRMTVRLEHGGKIYGLMSVSLSMHLVTDPDEQDLFSELTGDIAFSLHNIEVEEKHKRAVEGLRKSEARLAEAQRVAHLGNWDWDIVNNELQWSDEIYHIFGLAPQQFGATYEAFLNYVHPDDREFVKKSVNEALHQGKFYCIDHRIVLPEGSERIVHEQAKVFFDESGKPVRMLGTVQNITERKRAEEALRDSRDKLNRMQLRLLAVLRSTPYGLCMIASNWTIIWANSAMIRMLGLKSDTTQKLKIPFKTIFPNEKAFNDYQKSALHSIRMTGIDVRELELKWSDGRRLWCEISMVRIDPHETGPGFVATVSDVTVRKQALEKLRKTFEDTVNVLVSAVEIRDPYTAGHQRRVAQLACAVASEIGLPDGQIESIRMSGLIHDIGKISVPAEILSKPSKLSEREMELIRAHPQTSFDLLKDIEFPWPVGQIVLQHHERMNGSGYPQGLSGDEIILEARIIAVADVVEAMASHRPYRPALGIENALEEISKNKGILYDTEAVNACIRLFGEQGYTFDNGQVIEDFRRWPRVKVELSCEVQLLIPEETFQPRIVRGFIIGLSERGAKVRLSSLPKEDYKKLTQPNRYIKVILSGPTSESKVNVIGKIIWLEYKGKEELLDLGTYFENIEPEAQTALQQIMEHGS